MRPGDRTEPPSVADAVSRAAALADPERTEPGVTGLIESFEDDTRPATASEDLPGELRSAAEALDPDGATPAVAATAAAAAWLATNPDHADEPERTLREGARLVFGNDPPPPLSEWLAARGID